jgi:hypothetical protein
MGYLADLHILLSFLVPPPHKYADIGGAHQGLPYGIDAVVDVVYTEEFVLVVRVGPGVVRVVVFWVESFADHVEAVQLVEDVQFDDIASLFVVREEDSFVGEVFGLGIGDEIDSHWFSVIRQGLPKCRGAGLTLV